MFFFFEKYSRETIYSRVLIPISSIFLLDTVLLHAFAKLHGDNIIQDSVSLEASKIYEVLEWINPSVSLNANFKVNVQ